MTRRPTEDQARTAIERFLEYEFGDIPNYSLYPDGDETAAENKCGWAFWFEGSEVTNYLHEDLSIEWYGGSPPPQGAGK